MLLNVCSIAARRGCSAALRSSHVRIPPLCVRSLSTTPQRFEAASGAAASAAAKAASASTTVSAEVATNDWATPTSLFDSSYLPHNNELFSEFIDLNKIDRDYLVQLIETSSAYVSPFGKREENLPKFLLMIGDYGNGAGDEDFWVENIPKINVGQTYVELMPTTEAVTKTTMPGVSAEELELATLAEGLDPEKLSMAGSLAELGLGGWSPSGLLQTLLCTINNYGLPWWATIAAGTLTFKLLLFPVTIKNQKYTIKMNNNMPKMQEIQARQRQAQSEGNGLEVMKANNEMMIFMKENDVNPLKSLLTMGAQAPIFISFFFALRGMANLPLDSMKTGGMLWFTDLTAPDPYYLLPIFTSLTLYATLRLGAESGMRLDNMRWGRYIVGAFPVILVPLTINFPAAVVCYWSTSNLFTLGQVAFLKIPAVRKYFGLPKLIRHNRESLALSSKGFIEGVKETYQTQKRTRMVQDIAKDDHMQFKQAGIGPIVKTYKHDPTKVKPSAMAVQAKNS